MKILNLKALYKQLQGMPHYKANPNQLTEEKAQVICKQYDTDLQFEMVNFKQANELGLELNIRPDSNGQGLNQYLCATRLFHSWLYSELQEGHCDSEAAARHEQYDE